MYPGCDLWLRRSHPEYRCAFVNWKDRATAELAAQAWANGLEIDGETVSIRWGRSKGASGAKGAKAGPSSVSVSA